MQKLKKKSPVFYSLSPPRRNFYVRSPPLPLKPLMKRKLKQLDK